MNDKALEVIDDKLNIEPLMARDRGAKFGGGLGVTVSALKSIKDIFVNDINFNTPDFTEQLIEYGKELGLYGLIGIASGYVAVFAAEKIWNLARPGKSFPEQAQKKLDKHPDLMYGEDS